MTVFCGALTLEHRTYERPALTLVEFSTISTQALPFLLKLKPNLALRHDMTYIPGRSVEPRLLQDANRVTAAIWGCRSYNCPRGMRFTPESHSGPQDPMLTRSSD
jgi:hypothetical protein